MAKPIKPDGPGLPTARLLLAAVLTVSLLAPAFALQNAPQNPQPPANPAPAPAPDAIPAAPANEPPFTLEQIDAEIKELEADATLDEEIKTRLLVLWRDTARQRLVLAQQDAKKLAQYRQAVDSGANGAAEQAKAIRAQLEQMPKDATGLDSADMPAEAEALSTRLTEAESKLNEAKAAATQADGDIKALQGRPAERVKELADAQAKLEELQRELAEPAPPNERPNLTEARQASQRVRRYYREQQVQVLRQEELSEPARLDLAKAKKELADRRVLLAQARVNEIQQRLTEARADEAVRNRSIAERDVVRARRLHPAIQDVAAENLAWARDLETLAAPNLRKLPNMPFARKQLDEFEDDLTRLTADFEAAKERLDDITVAGAMGQELRELKADLPDLRGYETDAAARETELNRVQSQLRRIERRIRELADLDAAVQRIMAEKIAPDTPAEQRPAAEAELRRYLTKQLVHLAKLRDLYAVRGEYRENLRQLQEAQKALVDQAQQYAEYLDGRLLWIRSGEPVSLDTIKDLGPALQAYFGAEQWQRVLIALRDSYLRNPVLPTLGVMAFLVLTLARPRLRRRMVAMAGRLGKVSTDSIALTFAGLGITIVLAARVPLLFAIAGRMLLNTPSGQALEFPKAVGEGLLRIAIVVFLVQLLRLICKPHGLGGPHFRWRQNVLSMLRHNLLWLLFIIAPVVFLTRSTEWLDIDAHRHSLGRFAFIVGTMTLAVWVFRVFHPTAGAYEQLLSKGRSGWLWKLRWVLLLTLVAVPVGLALLSAMGYYYTAMQLLRKLIWSIWMLVGLVVVYNFVLRWLAVAQARLAFSLAKQRREQALAERTAKAAGETPDSEAPPPIEVPDVKLSDISEQSRSLLRFAMGVAVIGGLWLAWSSALPALQVLDRWNIWTTGEGESIVRVTLAHVIVAMIALIFTIVMAKNLPGVLEIAVLQRLELESGVRYAITTLSQYAITIIGLLVTFNLIGINWESLQWLAAALTVGLGFGLQEIVANFVSGIILLFERPIRVGDIVTVGETTGVVSRIRIRATTITNWERQEFIIPNKEFVTGRLLNWTLSDKVNRLVINVGVAYGSDTDKVREVLQKILADHPLVMAEPASRVIFEGFGDSSLNFSARFFLPNMDNRLEVIHQMHTAINKAFAANGIEIPFPQRDLHIRSAPAPIHITGANGHGDGEAGGKGESAGEEELPDRSGSAPVKPT